MPSVASMTGEMSRPCCAFSERAPPPPPPLEVDDVDVDVDVPEVPDVAAADVVASEAALEQPPRRLIANTVAPAPAARTATARPKREGTLRAVACCSSLTVLSLSLM